MKEQRKKILIVDDSEMNREILVSMLEDEYDLIQAEDGQQAVYIMSEHHMELSLLLLDMNMPVMNGYEATAAIRSHRKYREKQIPIIAMTANAFAEDVVMAKNAGMKEHIAKPWEMNRLCEIMQRYL